MTPVTIRPLTVEQFERESNGPALLAEYEAESANKRLPPAAANMELFRAIETSGAMFAAGAYREDQLIGFVVVISTKLPHYGVLFSTTQSFFVASEHRHTGAGVKLLRAAEEHAKDIGSPGLFISAPVGGVLVDVLSHSRHYSFTNAVFYRSFE